MTHIISDCVPGRGSWWWWWSYLNVSICLTMEDINRGFLWFSWKKTKLKINKQAQYIYIVRPDNMQQCWAQDVGWHWPGPSVPQPREPHTWLGSCTRVLRTWRWSQLRGLTTWRLSCRHQPRTRVRHSGWHPSFRQQSKNKLKFFFIKIQAKFD